MLEDIRPYEEAVRVAADLVAAAVGRADIAIVLGSGLGGFVSSLTDARSIDYSQIPGFPVSTVPGHAGRWWSGELAGKRVYMLQGRFHAYEGWSMRELTMYVRMLKRLGTGTLLLTNAAGCVELAWQPGDLMLIEDFINYTGLEPLSGPNLEEDGPRFPDMSHVFDPDLLKTAHAQAQALGLDNVRQGVYMWFHGPRFETPAEIRMARIVGAHAVGMSTVPEAIVARHCGMRVLGISCLTNMAAGILDQPLTHAEVTEVAERVKGSFTALLTGIVGAM